MNEGSEADTIDAREVLDPARVADFERRLLASSRRRIDREQLWRAFADAFPGRPDGRDARRWLRRALDMLAERGVIALPAPRGRRWDRALGVAVPTSVDLCSSRKARSVPEWRRFPWDPRLAWVADLDRLTAAQERFLYAVHEGLVRGSFERLAPLRHRSLQLTGDEKGLERLLSTSLFGPGRLDLDLLGCAPEVPPLVWESAGNVQRALVLENAGPFAMALDILRGLAPSPYGVVVWGGGARFEASLPYLRTVERITGRTLDRIDYVGDIDAGGLRIASAAAARARALALAPIVSAPQIHAAMLEASQRLGHADGWRARSTRTVHAERLESYVEFLPSDVRQRVQAILSAERRIPEEVLGPEDLEELWSGTHRDV